MKFLNNFPYYYRGRGRPRSRWEHQVSKDITQTEGRMWKKIEKELWEDRQRGLVVRQHIKWKHLRRRRRRRKKNIEAEEFILKHHVLICVILKNTDLDLGENM